MKLPGKLVRIKKLRRRPPRGGRGLKSHDKKDDRKGYGVAPLAGGVD